MMVHNYDHNDDALLKNDDDDWDDYDDDGGDEDDGDDGDDDNDVYYCKMMHYDAW